MANGTLELTADGFARIMEAADFLNVSRATIYVLMNDGTLPSKKIGRSRRIPWNGLREYAASDLLGVDQPK